MELIAQPVVHLSALVPDGAEILATGVGTDGSVLCVARKSSEPLARSKRGAVFPKSRHAAPTDLYVGQWAQGTVRHTVVAGLSTIPHFVQPLDDGFLLAGARCYWRGAGPETNGSLCSWEGDVRASITLGDGIQDLRTTSGGQIWVSYFDEGVFGNYGWASPGPEPIGAPGIVRFAGDGTIEFRYDAEAAGTDTICDTYAMNVAGDSKVWTCFYTEFPIVELSTRGYHTWAYGTAGASAMAVHGRRVLMAGDYKLRNKATVLALESDDRARTRSEGELVTADGTPLTTARFTGIGPTLYATQDKAVYRVDGW